LVARDFGEQPRWPAQSCQNWEGSQLLSVCAYQWAFHGWHYEVALAGELIAVNQAAEWSIDE